MKRTGPTNGRTRELITALHKLGVEKNAPLWRRIAYELQRSTRSRREVNLIKLNLITKENEVIIVPGKVLGSGELTHKLTIAAMNASQSAIDKIKQSGSKYLDINELMKSNPNGSGIRIIG